jgi:hypothetical protein
MADRLNKGTFGEQGHGFFLGARGYFFVEGPSGAGGHAANAPGFDGVAFNPTLNDLIICDNKAFASTQDVRSATAIDPAVNLARNLDGLIDRLTQAKDIPHRIQILNLLRSTRMSLTATGVAPPPNVRIAVTNFGGKSRDIAQSLRNRGITFIDMNAAPSVPRPADRDYFNREIITEMPFDASQGADAYNARRSTMDAAAVAVATVAQVADNFGLEHSIKNALGRLAEEITETVVTKGSALVVVRIAASSTRNEGAPVARSVASAFVFSAASGLTRQKAIDLHTATGSYEASRGAHVDMETRYYWYGPHDMQ